MQCLLMFVYFLIFAARPLLKSLFYKFPLYVFHSLHVPHRLSDKSAAGTWEAHIDL